MARLRFLLANGSAVEVPGEVVERIITTRLSNCFDARCHMAPSEVLACLDWLAGKESPGEPWRCVWHMVFYAENLVFSVYLYKLAAADDPDEYLEFMMPALEKARELARAAREELERGRVEEARKLSEELLWHLIGYGIDPW